MQFITVNASTGASFININGIGSKSLTLPDGTALTDQIVSGEYHTVRYNDADNRVELVAVSGLEGDVVGPGSAVDDQIAVFDGITGKLIKDSGQTIADIISVDVIVLRDEKTSGSDGGTATSGSWLTRPLNTETTDTGNHSILSSNQFTLSAGTYEIFANAPFVETGVSQIKLYNTTSAADIIIGANALGGGSVDGWCLATLYGLFTVTAGQALEIQYRITQTEITDGLGRATGWGTEVYCQVFLKKVA